MEIAIKAIMCLSFVTGTYEVVVATYNWERQWVIGGDLRAMCWRKWDEKNYLWDEARVRTIIGEDRWQQLMADNIIETDIRMSMKEYFDKTKNL